MRLRLAHPRLAPLCGLATLLALLLPTGHAEEGNRVPQVGAPPAWIEPVALPTVGQLPESSVGRHYLVIESQTHVAARTQYRRNAYRIVSEAGLRHGAQVNLSFDPTYETLTFHHLRVIRDGVVINKLAPDRIQVLQQERDLQRLMYNGQLSAHVILEDIRVGDTVDLAYSIAGWNPVFGDRYIDAITLGWGIPVSHLRHRVVCPPAGRPIRHRVAGDSPARLTETRTPLGRELLWEARDLPAVTFDNNTPWWHEAYAYVQLTDFASWAEVVDWALPLYPLDVPLTPALRQQADALAVAHATPEARTLAALKLVQEQVRYLGIEMGAGSHRPSPPGEVFARRFGDCKDKAYLLCRLLQELDIRAVPLLVHSSRRHTLKDWLPSPYAFDHVIVLATVGPHSYMLDPTLLHQRGSLAHHHTTMYGPGLRVRPGVRELLEFPRSGNDVSRTEVDEVFTVPGFEAPAELVVRTTSRGRAAEAMRDHLADSTREDLTKSYLDFYAHYYPEIASAGPITWTDDEAENRLVVEERYRITNLFVRPDGSRTRKAEFYPTALNDYTNPIGAGGRTAPLRLAHPVEIVSRTVVDLFEPWPLKPETIDVNGPGIRFQRTIGGVPDRLEFTYRWTSLDDHVKPADFAAHARDLVRVRELLGYELTYTEPVSGLPDPGFEVNWGMVALATFAVAVGLAAALAAIFFWPRGDPPVIAPDPSHPNAALTGLGGWLILVGIGVVLRPPVFLYEISRDFAVYFDLATWRAATDATAATYQPAYAVIAPLELSLNLLLFLLCCLLVFLFFARRRSFPPLMQAFLALQILSAGFSVWSFSALAGTDPADQTAAFRQLAQAFTAALVWIPYFSVSRRVKLTFTR